MASPFAVFRKNQKVMLAVLTILAMFGFIFLPILGDLLGAKRGGVGNPVLVKTTAFGDLHASDIGNLQKQKQMVLRVLTSVIAQSFANPEQTNAGAIRQWLENDRGFGPATEEAVVNRWLLAKQAEKQGIVISDATINAFLKEITQDKVTVDQFRTAFRNAGVKDRQFFHALRSELMVNELESLFRVSLYATTPGQRWDYFNRVNRMASVEAIPVAVSSFTKQVSDPTDAELKAFFEKHKHEYPEPTSAEPGFKRAPKVALQYFKADSEKLMASVTDEEIRQRYEKNKESYDQLFKKPADKPATEKAAEAEKTDAAKDTKEKDTAPAGEQKAVTEPKAEAKDATKADQKPTEKETPKDQPKESEKKDSDSKATSSVDRSSSVMLVSLTEDQQPNDAKPNDTAKAATGSSEPAKKPEVTEKPATADKPQAPAPAETAPATKKAAAASEKAPTAERAAATATDKVQTATPNPAAAEKPADKATDKAAAPAAEPQSGLTTPIKNMIRQEIASEKLSKVFDGLREQMDQYRRLRSEYDVKILQGGDAKKLQPPAPLDIQRLAKENGVATSQTPLLPQWDLRSTEIGRSLISGRVPVEYAAYQSLPKFRPETSIDGQGNLYLLWKIDETKVDEKNPVKFEDPGVRDEVLAAWKLVHARDLANKQAKSLADEARKAQKPLKDVFASRPEVQVIAPPPFSWMTFGNVAMGRQQRAVLSNVPQIDLAGTEFMKSVFGLDEAGQVAVAFNAPQTVAYVVRLKEFSPSHSVLWDIFQASDFRTYASAGAEDYQQTQLAWFNDIKTAAGFEWVAGHRPDETSEQGQPVEE